MRFAMPKKLFMIFLLCIVGTFAFAEESQAIRICKENFDAKIEQLNTQKNNLSELIRYASDKQTVVQKAIDNIGEYEKKVVFLTKVNLMKSILKLGFAIYQELSPLGGTSGKLLEICEWFEEKAQDYILNAALDNKDYYNKHIQFLSDDAKELTPEVVLLTKMQEAGLEAFKIKIYREQNQTAGDVGALFAKLKALSEQSIKAQTSLKLMNQRLNLLIKNQSKLLGQIDDNIALYVDAKDATCRDLSVPFEPENESNLTVEISYFPQYPECVSDEDAQAAEDSLCEARRIARDAEDDFKQQFNDKFTAFYEKLFDEQNSALQMVEKSLKIPDIYNLDYNECNLKPDDCSLDSNDSRCAIESIIDTSNEQLTYNYNLYDNYYKMLKSHEDEFKKFLDDFLANEVTAKFKDSELAVSNIVNKLSNCSKNGISYEPKYCEYDVDDFDIVVGDAKASVSYEQYLYYQKINDAKSLSAKAKEELDTTFKEIVKTAKDCVSQDRDYLPVVQKELEDMENRIDEYTMSKKNFLNFLSNLEKEKMITVTHESYDFKTYFSYKIDYQYFKDMYDNFNGTDIEFFKKIQDILRPVITDLSKLNNFFISAKTLAQPDGTIASYIYSYSLPVVNIDGVSSLKDEYVKMTEENFPPQGSDVYDISNILEFGDKILSGNPDFNHVINITQSIYQDIDNRKTQLGSWIRYKDVISDKKSLDDFKKEIYSAQSFAYNVQSVVSDVLDFSDLEKYIDDAKSTILQKAIQILPSSEIYEYDLNTTVSSCKSQILDLNLSKELVVIVGDENATLDIMMNSCDDRGLSLIAEVNSTDNVLLSPSWNQDFSKITPPDFTEDFYKNKSARLTLSSKNYLDGNYNLTVKLLDKYDDIITKTIPVKVISSTTKKEIKRGWNLVSGNFDVANLANDIDVVWHYKDGYWFANSPFQNKKDLIKKAVLYSDIRLLNNSQNSDGIWIYAINHTYIDMFNVDTDTTVRYKNGWSLDGVYKDTYMEDIVCENQDFLPLIWKYSDGSWKYYDINSTAKDTKILNTNDGFWVLCR